jgi:DNA repair protein RecO (recombination protein O)
MSKKISIEDEGIILYVRNYGDNSFIVKIFSKNNGKIVGFIKNNNKESLGIGNLVSFTLRKRLEEHMGVLSIETQKAYSSLTIKSRLKNIMMCILCESIFFLTEEENIEKEIYMKSVQFLNHLLMAEEKYDILIQYALFEMSLLSFLGFGFDLSRCAISGKKENIYFLSPVSGRGAGFAGGAPYKEKLLEVPFIFGNKESPVQGKIEDIINAFKVTSHFLARLPNFYKITSRNYLSSLYRLETVIIPSRANKHSFS